MLATIICAVLLVAAALLAALLINNNVLRPDGVQHAAPECLTNCTVGAPPLEPAHPEAALAVGGDPKDPQP
jgi:hypothetical protein